MDIFATPLTNILSHYSYANYKSVLLSMQKVMAESVSASIGVIRANGEDLSHYSLPIDKAHQALFSSPQLLTKLSEQLSDLKELNKAATFDWVGNLFLSVCPVAVGSTVVAYAIIGPFWQNSPNEQQSDLLAQYFNWSNQELAEALYHNPASRFMDQDRCACLVCAMADFIVKMRELIQRQQEAANALSCLYDMSTDIGRSLDVNDILPSILERAMQVFQADAGSISLLDESKQNLHIYLKEGPMKPFSSAHNVPIGKDLREWLVEESTESLTDCDGLCTLKVPLSDDSSCIGSMRVSSYTPGAYNKDDLQILHVIAGYSSSSLSKAIVYQKAMRQYEELRALQEIGNSLNSSIDVPKTLHKVLDHACSLLGAKNASLMLLESDKQHLRIREAKGLSQEVIDKTRVRLGERVSGKVAQQGRPVSLPRGISSTGEELEAALCVPLKVSDKVIGVLNVRGHKDSNEFTEDDIDLATRLASMSAAAIENAELHDKLQNLFVESITALANAIDARDPYTRGHSERVAAFSVVIAERLNFTAEEIWDLRNAALLHDIGKIRIRDNILNKPDKLSNEEYEEMQRHAVYGAGIMMPVKSFRPLIPYILHHHERYDGGGYPDKKRGNEIPLCARIICVADSFDAMTSNRPYRKGMPIEKAIRIINENRGSQFDPGIADIFIELYHENKLQPIMKRLNSVGSGDVWQNSDNGFITSENGGKAVIWKAAIKTAIDNVKNKRKDTLL
ncbi:MAG: HD domain-containing phosphohydrolase [Candidatus Bruticola sp.]